MNKEALVDKAVEDLQGKLPVERDDFAYCDGDEPAVILCKMSHAEDDVSWCEGAYYIGTLRASPEYFIVICTTDKFIQRAKEKGFINGFEWGKEYPTNGKKPDLDDDVLVEVNFINPVWDKHTGGKVGSWFWGESSAFRIVDERYKPKQPESHSKPSADGAAVLMHDGENNSVFATKIQDNSWHEKGELPPAGTECVIFPRCDKARVTYMGSGVACYVDLSNGMEYSCATSSLEFRPIKTEKEKFVEMSHAVIGCAGFGHDETATDYFEAQYDAGCRFVSQESSR